MQQVVICNKRIAEVLPDNTSIETIQVEGVSVTVALIETDDTPFDPAAPGNEKRVLVKKRAFSCNYRDKAIVLSNAIKCNTEADEKVFFISIGSDFVADVVGVGPEVKDLKPGDRVIGGGHYPSNKSEFPVGDDYKGYAVGLPTNNASRQLDIFHFKKLIKIPEQMSDEVAATFTIGGITSYSMIRKLNIEQNDRVLITAAKSNTSLYALNALKKYKKEKNIKIYAASTSMAFEKELKELGVDEILLVDTSLEHLFTEEALKKIYAERIQFDCIIDPYWDLYLSKLVNYMAIGARYTTCGLEDQYSALIGRENDTAAQGKRLSSAITAVMISNIRIIGNCLGLDSDLQQAINDHSAGNFDVQIDSVFTENNVGKFFERTYNAKDRWGKVVYKYS